MSNYKIYDGDFGGYCVRDKDDEFVFETDSLETCNLIVSALEKQLNNDWIPVSERLPKVHKRYLVNMKHKSLNETFIDCRCFYSDYQFEYRNDFERRNWEVIAWQPLPEPWKGEEE